MAPSLVGIRLCSDWNTIWWLWKLNTTSTSTSTSISTNSIWWKASWVGGQPNRVGKVKSIWWNRLWLLKVKLSSPTGFPPLVRVASQTRSSYGPIQEAGSFHIENWREMWNGCNFRVITMRGRGFSFHGPEFSYCLVKQGDTDLNSKLCGPKRMDWESV